MKIKDWRYESNLTDTSRLQEIQSNLNDIDKKIDSSIASDEERQSRLQLIKERDDLHRLLSMDLLQKAKIQWDIEGDENSKFFHGIINHKRRHQSIQGIIVDGNWITNPLSIKEEFYKFYKSKFKSFDSSFDATLEEICKDVWDCGCGKSLGPHGFSFLFQKTYWDLFKDDIVNFVNQFMESGTMPKGTNSAFINLILKIPNPLLIKDYRLISLIGMQYKIVAKLLANRLSTVLDKLVIPTQSAFISVHQILNGPLMVSEIIEWHRKRNKRLMIFKVDFEKAFDTVSWNYLDFVLSHMGFGDMWRYWIRACLQSSRISILVNGSPTPEFSFERGLRQGDPLSPFLFILIMEGLKNNISKSNLFGIGVTEEDLHTMASVTGYQASSFPITYLSIPIGKSMHFLSSWNTLIDKFNLKLSKWKASLLSSGGRYTLIKFVLESLGNKKMAWVRWENVLASLDQGGLGIGSLKAFNLGCYFKKWDGSFTTNPDLLWVKLIKAIHGIEAGFDGKGCATTTVWSSIVGSTKYLHSHNLIPKDTLKCHPGNDASIHFWKDLWFGEEPLCTRYTRLFCLKVNEDCLLSERFNEGSWNWQWLRTITSGRTESKLHSLQSELAVVTLSSSHDLWKRHIGNDGSFSVASTRTHIDHYMIPLFTSTTTWIACLPRKVNIFLWRFNLDRLPHRLNLSKHGIEIAPALALLNAVEKKKKKYASICEDNGDTKWNECYDNEDELQSFRHKARQQDKVYEEREESCWILHLRTGIFYPKGHEGVMNEVPDGAAIFASMTRFRCGELSEYVSDKISFLDHLFREKKQKQVKVKELLQIIDNDKLWCALDDEDAVRVSLLFVLEIVFMGREEFLNVPLHILTLAEDFFAWNSFPWGEYMWRYFYKRTLNVVKIHAEKKDPKKMMTYNLNGFVWALKIWILESYPKSTLWWAKQQDVIPRGLAWSNFNRFQKTDYNLLFGQDSIPNLVLLPTSGELKADWWVRSQYYFKGEDAPFIQSVKPKCIDLQRCDSKVADYVNGVPLVQRTPRVLRNVGSSYKGLIEPKIIDTVYLLCKQLIDVRPEMEGMFDKLKSKVIDTLTTTLESARNHAEVVEAKVVNCETNLVECPLVEKDVGVLRVAVDSCDMNLVDCPVVHKENSEPKHFMFTDTQPSTMEHFLMHDTNDTNDNYMDFDNNPSQYCLDNMSIGIEKDTQNGELTVTLYEEPQKETAKCSEHTEKMGLRGEDKQIANENSDFDTLLKDGNMNLDKLIADVTKSENKSLQMIKASEVNVVKGDGKPVLGNVFENIGRIKKPGIFKQLPYMQQRPTTPQVKKKRKRFNNLNPIEFSLTAPSEHDCSQQTLQPFKEVLRRNCKSNPTKVTVPACMKSFLRNGIRPKQLYKFPWVKYGIVVDEHFCVITVYDSMPPSKRNKKLPIQKNREFWIKLRETMSQQLPVYLDCSGVLKSKGLDVTRYKINFQFSEKVPFQASVYGDYGIWVCILLFRLTHGLPLVFDDPLQTAIAYREHMLAYF
ncbi:RNA-directed DNA polymerase, eukaryota, reverse transcriptase zinc-binding domain protein [Tanacetum coccineum]